MDALAPGLFVSRRSMSIDAESPGQPGVLAKSPGYCIHSSRFDSLSLAEESAECFDALAKLSGSFDWYRCVLIEAELTGQLGVFAKSS